MRVLRGVGCGLVVGVGLLSAASVPGASAYSVSGGSYSGVPTMDPTFVVAGSYAFSCPKAVVLHGGLATGSATTAFSSYYGGTNACTFFGFPATATSSGNRSLTITSGPGGLGGYYGTLHIPATWTTTYSSPIAGCTVTVSGTQNFVDGVNDNIVGAWNKVTSPIGMNVTFTLDHVVFTATGCPFSSGSNGVLSEQFFAAGITVS